MEKGSLLSINGNEFKITESDEFTFVVTEGNKNEVTILPSGNQQGSGDPCTEEWAKI